MNPSSLYSCANRGQKGLIETVRKYIETNFHKVFSEWRRSGGDDGDLSEEVAQLDRYELPNGAGLQLYTVQDDSTNGYAEFISVHFPEKSTDEIEKLVALLTKLDFVSSHKNLRERPQGYKSFKPYMDYWYHESNKKPFGRT